MAIASSIKSFLEPFAQRPYPLAKNPYPYRVGGVLIELIQFLIHNPPASELISYSNDSSPEFLRIEPHGVARIADQRVRVLLERTRLREIWLAPATFNKESEHLTREILCGLLEGLGRWHGNPVWAEPSPEEEKDPYQYDGRPRQEP